MHNELPSYGQAPAGAIRYNTDSNKLEVYIGGPVGYGTLPNGQWMQVDNWSPENQTGGTRALYGGGDNPSDQSNISYINVDSTGNAITFGDLTDAKTALSGCSSRTRGLFCGGYYPTEAKIEYVTISSTGDASVFGDLTEHRISPGSLSSSTRGITAGGRTSPSPALTQKDTMDYVTIASTGASKDFGNLSTARNHLGEVSSSTRGVFAGGYIGPGFTSRVNIMDFITISTLGNAADFGDLIDESASGGGCSNSIRGLFFGGQATPSPVRSNVIEYVTISTLGNSIDFGDLTVGRTSVDGAASPTRGVFIGGASSPVAPNRTNTIDYVQIMSTGNAIDFGDMNTSTPPSAYGSFSNGHGGL